MAEFQLHCFAQSGNAYKAALMLALCEADWDPVFVDFFQGETRGEAYRALNPMGEVPILTHGATRLTQSGIILDYLAGTFGRFLPEGETAHRELWRWILWDNHKLTANLATARFMMNFLPLEKRDPAVIAFLSGRARAALGVLDTHLADRSWMVGDAPSIADLSCIGYLFFTDETEIDMAPYPAVMAWRDRVAALPGWRHPYDLMPGHPFGAAVG